MTNKLYVKEIKGKGRGVFCKETIYKDEAIEICPLLVLPSNDFDALSSTQLIDYIFNFNAEEKTIALAPAKPNRCIFFFYILPQVYQIIIYRFLCHVFLL